ncbi:hypothetical protein [Kitasatospora sp. GAS204B]|uniref:hypothetical protein n=1 Tax=unclassified Kitasatospora TaxID=2633591 RepID=UPI0024772614|nr:hypothetical protein [Kitasatospora sp. GAS204B]MDH6120713.1 hypothetical protein [Kitasatospora sp. GAS204B]
MPINKTLQRVAAVSLVAVAAVAGATVSASAAEGNWNVTASSTCVATEQVQLINGHDYMQVDPNSNGGGCQFGIWDWNNSRWVYGPTTYGGLSGWYYDGPGYNMSVCAQDGGAWVCGPAN